MKNQTKLISEVKALLRSWKSIGAQNSKVYQLISHALVDDGVTKSCFCGYTSKKIEGEK